MRLPPPRQSQPLQPQTGLHDFAADDFGILYFREFVALVQNPWMTGLSNSETSLWTETLPQVCRNDPTLRSAAMAVGAVAVCRRQKTEILCSTSPSSPSDAHHLRALSYYGAALQRQGRHASLRSTAFLALLLLIFESVRMQNKAALSHVNHGMALLLSVVASPIAADAITCLSPNPRPVLAQLADVFTHLAMQTRLVLGGRVGKHVPLPDLARGLQERDMTMEAFVLLLSRVSRKAPRTIPEVFTSLDDFEDHLVSVTRRQAEMGPIMLQAMESTRILDMDDHERIADTFPSLLRDPRVLGFSATAQREMEALDRAFRPLLDDMTASAAMDSPTYLRAICLRLRFLAVYIFNNPPQYADVDAMITLGPRFREFTSLAGVALRVSRRSLLGAYPASQMLCIDGGIAWQLLLVSLHCRDPITRDEATLLLSDYPGQDGLWSTRALHALAVRNRLLERDNAVEGSAQEQWRRLWRREYYMEDGGERLIFRFLVKCVAPRAWVLAEEVADLGEDGDAAAGVEWKRHPSPESGRLLLEEATLVGRQGRPDVAGHSIAAK